MIEVQKQAIRQTLSIGRGLIGPDEFVDSGNYTWDQVNNLEAALINDPTVFKHLKLGIPLHCADGRTKRCSGSSAIGGTFSLVMADALGPRKFYTKGTSAKSHALRVYDFFADKGLKIGGHVDNHSTGPNCGCGGEDRLGPNMHDPSSFSILNMLSENSNDVRRALEELRDTKTGVGLGIEVSNAVHQLVTAHAQDLFSRSFNPSPYATGGADLRDAMRDSSAEIEILKGPHQEAFMLVDTREDYVLDRSRLDMLYSGPQVFYLNTLGLKIGIDMMYGPSEQDLGFMGALYYNMAATAVLASSSLRVLTLTQ